MMKIFELIARRGLLVLALPLILLPLLFSCRTIDPAFLFRAPNEDAEEYIADMDMDIAPYEDYLTELVPTELVPLEEPVPELVLEPEMEVELELEMEAPELVAEEDPALDLVPDIIMEIEPELVQVPPVLPEPEPIEPLLPEPEPPIVMPEPEPAPELVQVPPVLPEPEPIEPLLPEPEPPIVMPEPEPAPELVQEPLEPEPLPPAPEPEPPLVMPPPEPVPEPEPPVAVPPPPPPAPPLVVPPPPPFFGPPEPIAPPPAEAAPIVMLPELPGRTIPDAAEEEIAFSRIVRIVVGQILEIPFRGTGWVFLGELDNRQGLTYDSRRQDTVGGSVIGQSFVFRAEAAGTYALRFFRQDFIQDYIINDHVQVIVEEAPSDRGRVIAEPRWPPLPGEQWLPPVLTPAPDVHLAAEPAAEDPALPIAAALPAPLPAVPPLAAPPPLPAADSPADYVRRARAEFDADRVAPALAILDEMRLRFPSGSDEAWLLYAQLFEANSPSRDIQQSLEFYRRLVNEYPHSNLVAQALQRIAHLERFFFNIR